MNKSSIPKKLLPFIWFFLKQHPYCLLTFFFVGLFAATRVSLEPYLLKVIIDIASQESKNPEQLLPAILTPALIYGMLPLFMNFVFRSWNYAYLVLFPKMRTEIISKMFDYLSAQSHGYFQSNFSGALANKISDMPQGIESILLMFNTMIWPRFVAVLIACVLLYTVNSLFTFILFIWTFVFLGSSLYVSNKARGLTVAFSEANSAVSGQIVDSVANIASAKIFTNVEHESHRIQTFLEDLSLKDRVLQWYFLKMNFMQDFLYFLLVVAMLGGAIYGRIGGWITLGDFAFILTLVISISIDIYKIAQTMPDFYKQIGKCEQALSIIITPIEIQDEKDAKPIRVSKGKIEFKDVTFAYLKERLVFEHLNLSINEGTKLGLVGFSGGGKSTLVNLILRLYDIQSGEISIDNQDIKKVSLDSLRKCITYIPQDPQLFHRSIMDNIRYGKMEATDEEVIEAAKKAYCHEFIEEMPQGYLSFVGERGVKLSGGQKQRIAIARAILKQAPILILDEATSSLDSVTEKYIQKSLHEIMENKTVIAIAHRLSTLSEMDRILFLKEGKVIEDGTIQTLKQQKGYFAKLWNMQQEGFLPIKFTEVFLKPARFFKSPMDILESLEFTHKDKIQILRTWRYDIMLGVVPEEEKQSSLSNAELSRQIENALSKLMEDYNQNP